MSSIIPVNRKCNHHCLFCSAADQDEPSDEQILKQIENEDEQIVLTGGEPTLKDNIIKLVKKAKEQGVEEVEFQTNGTLLYYKDVARKLENAGVDIFNVNFPSHKEETFDKMTQTQGHFPKVVRGINNLLKFGGNIRITNVICSINDNLVDYAKFIQNNFQEIKILEYNPVKVRGRVKENKYLVPSFQEMEGELYDAMEFCEKNGINLLVDGAPLCYMKGYEKFSIDLIKLLRGQEERLHAKKEKTESCEECSLSDLCLGFREGYPQVNGDEAKPRNIDPEKIKNKFNF